MKIYYDFHIHSDLSPCADVAMTPYNIVGMAYIKGLNCIAIADHNHIANVKVAMLHCENIGVTVIPAMELQTEEDIHILCLFYNYEQLSEFFSSIKFPYIENNSAIWGEQNIYNEEDEIVGKEKRLLIAGAAINAYETIERVHSFGGLAIPAHIDRDANGILSILGMIGSDMDFDAVEFSNRAGEAIIAEYSSRFSIIKDSDAHMLEDISEPENEIDAPNCTIKDILDAIKRKR